jgi:hypothetical protein
VEGGTYRVDLSFAVAAPVTKDHLARYVTEFAKLLPDGSRIVSVGDVPAAEGVADVVATIRAISPAEALRDVARAVEASILATDGSLGAFGPLRLAVVEHDPEAPPPA